jgi:predicted Zn-dependent peptidase
MFLNYERYVQAVTTADLQRAAQLLYKGDNFFKAVLYPEK